MPYRRSDQPVTEAEKKRSLNEIKNVLEFLKRGPPTPEKNPLWVEELEFYHEELQAAFPVIAGHYVYLMAWGHDFSERVRARIQANLTPAEYKQFETAVKRALLR